MMTKIRSLKYLLLIFIISISSIGIVNRVEYTDNKYISVYTPHDYNKEKKYNVLILIAGINFNDKYWFGTQQYNDYKEVNFKDILDNNIKNKEIEPLIVVSIGHSKKLNDEIPDIVNYIKSNYSVYEDRNKWAFGGYSAGALDTVRYAMNNYNDLFGNYCLFSGGCKIYNENININYLYACYGSSDVGMWDVLDTINSLKDMHIINDDNYDIEIINGTSHSWKTAIDGVQNFLKIFSPYIN